MDDQRRTVLLAAVAQVFGDTAANDESTPAQRGDLCAVTTADHRADAVNTSIRAEAGDDLKAWYQRWQQLTVDGEALYMALLAEMDQRLALLVEQAQRVLFLSTDGRRDLAVLAATVAVLERSIDEVDQQWDTLEAKEQPPTLSSTKEGTR